MPPQSELPEQKNEHVTTEGKLDRWLEWPMVVLAAVWLALLVVELVRGISPALERLGLIIWGVFVAEFAIRFTITANRRRFLRRNWLTALTLLVPALRVLRVFRIASAVRGVRLVRIVGSVNRGMNSLGRTLRRRGLPYVAAITIFVLLIGAAGIYAFERAAQPSALQSYGDALWWTAMLLTTIGSDYWPSSAEGRLLTLFLSLYALGILGYVAASMAAFFIGQEAEEQLGQSVQSDEVSALREELARLREQLLRAERPAGNQ